MAPAGITTVPVQLTEFARCAGCASKMGPGDLSTALRGLSHASDPRLIVGRESFDDAAAYRVSDDLVLIQTVDFFAPIVNDPYAFGQIAAANALSDVYAMGGVPKTALNVLAFPVDSLPLDVMAEILAGGQDKVHEAGALVVGGHTVTDVELKYGLSVTGFAHPDRLLVNTGAAPGDQLVLTKPIGTGVLATAVKKGMASPEQQERLQRSMSALNNFSSAAALEVGARCATDITGFGLLGHALNIVRGSSVSIGFQMSTIPLLPGAAALWESGARTGGADRNLRHVESSVEWGAATDVERGLLVDPQTSGGLLVAVPQQKLALFLSLLPDAVHVGEVLPSVGRPLIQVF